MPRRLPPLSQLRAFEAAARRRSFKLAADELAVTPAAVSHQVKALESHLGVVLFERLTRQVIPTPTALRLLPPLSSSFDAMAEALAAVQGRGDASNSVTLSTTRAFMAQWLMPRLNGLKARHPRIRLTLHADEAPVDVMAGEADLAVRYGDGPYPGVEAVRLAEDRYVVVCSPQLRIRSRKDLLRHTLIHFDWRQPTAETPGWHRWLQAAGLSGADADGGLRFSDEVHAIQAAIAGQGVALLSAALVRDELERGVLRSPFGPALQGHSYWLLRRKDGSAAARHVARWLMAQAASLRT